MLNIIKNSKTEKSFNMKPIIGEILRHFLVTFYIVSDCI